MNPGNRVNPFKGLYYYEEADKDIFFGRDNLSRELFNLVALNGLTLVFGKSGIGKTSLLNAGLFPLLRDADFLPVRLRLDYSSSGAPLIEQVKQRLQNELRENKVIERVKGGNEPAPSFSEEETLWEYFHRVDHVNEDGKTVTPILVFDQFEEIFTIGKRHPDRDLLIDELNDLVEDQVPAAVKERLLSRVGMFPYLRSQIAVRVVFGLREDYLPHMNALKPRIPSIHRVMFRVIHLNGIQAREVLDRTGAFSNERIKQDILHQFEPVDLEPAQTITLEKLEVEPALLSLLCYQVFEQGVESLSVRDKDAILSGFYDRVLAQLPRGSDLAQWIESHLITEGGFRTPFYLEKDLKLRETVESAIDKKLLRKLHIGEKEHVEIIHDVLATMIKEKRDQRIEEKKRYEMENEVLRKRLEMEKEFCRQRSEMEKELSQKRMIIRIISIAAIIATYLTIFALIQKNRADAQYRNAVSLRLASEASFKLPTDNDEAFRIAEAAYKIGSPNPEPAVMRALIAAAYSNRKHLFCTTLFNNARRINTSVFSPNGGRILTASDDKTAKRWDLKGNLLTDFKGHMADVYSAVFSPDGKYILTASADHTAKLWDLKGNVLVDLKGHTAGVNSAAFSLDGQQILTASTDHTAKLWDLKGNLLADFKGHTSDVSSAVFSPHGGLVLTISIDHTAKLWDLKGNLLPNIKKQMGYVYSAVFSPDGGRILIVSTDNTTKLWDLLNDKFQNDFKGHTNVTSAVFSPDGGRILTTSNDNTAKLWDLKGNILADFKGHTGPVTSAVFSPDGKRIITASADGTAIIWPTPEGIMDWLKTAPIPQLTQKEKKELGIADFQLD